MLNRIKSKSDRTASYRIGSCFIWMFIVSLAMHRDAYRIGLSHEMHIPSMDHAFMRESMALFQNPVSCFLVPVYIRRYLLNPLCTEDTAKASLSLKQYLKSHCNIRKMGEMYPVYFQRNSINNNGSAVHQLLKTLVTWHCNWYFKFNYKVILV